MFALSQQRIVTVIVTCYKLTDGSVTPLNTNWPFMTSLSHTQQETQETLIKLYYLFPTVQADNWPIHMK